MTQETGKCPNGAAAAMTAVRPARTPRHDYYEGIPRLGAAAVNTSYAIVNASSRQFTTLNSVFLESGDRSRWRRARRVTVISVLDIRLWKL